MIFDIDSYLSLSTLVTKLFEPVITYNSICYIAPQKLIDNTGISAQNGSLSLSASITMRFNDKSVLLVTS